MALASSSRRQLAGSNSTLPLIVALGTIGVSQSYFGLLYPQLFWGTTNVTPMVGWLFLALAMVVWLPFSFSRIPTWIAAGARLAAALATTGLAVAEALAGRPYLLAVYAWVVLLALAPWVPWLRDRPNIELGLAFCLLLGIGAAATNLLELTALSLLGGTLLLWHTFRPRPRWPIAAGLVLLMASAFTLVQSSLPLTALTLINSLGLLTYRFFGSDNRTITSRYFRAMALIGVVPLLLLGSFLTYTGQGKVVNQSLSHMAYTASQSAQALESEVWAAVGVINELAQSPALPNTLESADNQRLDAILDSAFRFHNSLTYIGVVRADGSVVADRRTGNRLSAEILQRLPQHRYELFVARRPVGPEPYLDSEGHGFLVAAFPIPTQGEPAALLGVVSMDRIDVRFHQVAGPTGFHHMLLDLSRNLVISDHDTRYRMVPLDSQGWQEDLAQTLLRDSTPLVRRNGMDLYASYAPIPSWGWGVLVYQDIHTLLGQTAWISWANLAALLATLGLTLSLSMASSKELTMPLLNLSSTARRIKESYTQSLTTQGATEAMEGELGEIASTLNILVDRIAKADEAVDQHARRLEEQTRRSQTLQEANRRLSTLLSLAQDALRLDIDPLLHSVVERLGYTCSATVTLWWMDGSLPRPVAAYSRHGVSSGEATPSTYVLAAGNAKSPLRGALRLSDGTPAGWAMAVPIEVDGRTVATLELKRQGPAFVSEEEHTVEAAASVTAMAIRLNNLYSSAQRQAALYKRLGQMAEQTIATLDPHSALQRTLSGAMDLAGSQCGLACYLDPDRKTVVADGGAQCLATPQSLMNRLLPYLTAADVVHCHDLQGELPILRVGSWLALALRDEDRVRGMMVLGFASDRSLAPEEHDALRLLARVASLALQRSQLFITAMQQRDLATTIVNTVPLAIVLASVPERRIVMANGTAASTGLNDLGTLDKAGFWHLMTKTAQWKLPYKAREVLWMQDGVPTYWDLNIWPMAEGPETVLLAAHDVTQSVTYRQKIHGLAKAAERGRAYLESILNSMTEGLLIVSDDHTITFANPRANVLLEADDLNGLPLQELAARLEEAGGLSPAAKAFLLDMGKSGDKAEIDLSFPKPRGLACQWFEISGAGSERVMGLLLRDITTQRELDRFRNNLISIVSHELRTPLTSILGFSELAAVKEFPPPELKRMMTMIHQQAIQLAEMVGEFLEAGRLSDQGFKPHLAPVDLAHIVESTIDVFRHNASQHAYHVYLPPDLPTVYADEAGLRQVLQNLLSNAVKYTPPPGRITITVSLANTEAVIAVADNGVGIPEDEKDKIFEKFYRVAAHSRKGIRGTGLGLTIARDIVVAHGGRIWVESREGQGSTFYFTLPINPELTGN